MKKILELFCLQCIKSQGFNNSFDCVIVFLQSELYGSNLSLNDSVTPPVITPPPTPVDRFLASVSSHKRNQIHVCIPRYILRGLGRDSYHVFEVKVSVLTESLASTVVNSESNNPVTFQLSSLWAQDFCFSIIRHRNQELVDSQIFSTGGHQIITLYCHVSPSLTD